MCLVGGLNRLLLLRLVDDDDIRLGDLGTHAATGIVRKHDDNLKTTDTRAHKDVLLGNVLVDDARITSLDHVTITEGHGIGTLGASLATDSDLTTTSTGLHDEANDAIASTTDSKTLEKLVLEGLTLSNGAETTVQDALDIELDLTLTETETLLDNGSKLTDALTILTEDSLGASSTDDDLSASGGVADLNTSEALIAEHASHELAKLAIEHTICNKLPLLRHAQCSRHFFYVIQVSQINTHKKKTKNKTKQKINKKNK